MEYFSKYGKWILDQVVGSRSRAIPCHVSYISEQKNKIMVNLSLKNWSVTYKISFYDKMNVLHYLLQKNFSWIPSCS